MVTNSVADEGQRADDFIELDGQKFLVHSPIQGDAVSEFTAGIKVGAVSYDEREHVFWAVLDDFSGGFGYRTLDLREEGGTHYDNDGGVDLRRPRHITLPPKRFSRAATANPTNISLYARDMPAAQSDFHSGTGLVYLGAGGAIYTCTYDSTTGNRTQATRQFELANTNRMRRILEFIDTSGNKILLACGLSTGSFNNEYHVNSNSADVTDWEDATTAGTSGIVFLSDMIVFNRQIIAQTTGSRIISSADGLNWSVDAGEDPIHRAGGFVRFIGVAMAPWGEPAVYFLDEGKLYVLDFSVRTAYQIEDVGARTFLTTGTSWGGAIYVTDGRNVWEYNPGNANTVRRTGLFAKESLPKTFAEDLWEITHFLPGTSDLFAVCWSLVTNETRLAVFNGVGWSWFAPSFSQTVFTAFLDSLPANLSLNATTRCIDVIATDAPLDASNTTLYHWRLPPMGDTPYVRSKDASDTRPRRMHFENGPLSWETGWFDGGFVDVEGTLFRIEINGYHMSEDETLLVEYRLNNQEDANYVTLGTFNRNQMALWFDTAKIGVPFHTVQFRLTLDRENASSESPVPTSLTDADSIIMAKSPELKAIILVYDKKPRLRTAWTVRIDVSGMVEKGETLADKPATTYAIWQHVKKLWNKPQLIKMVIPSIEENLHVRLSQMPGTFHDFNRQLVGKGEVTLTFLEPVVE